jgi:chorismate mutase
MILFPADAIRNKDCVTVVDVIGIIGLGINNGLKNSICL